MRQHQPSTQLANIGTHCPTRSPNQPITLNPTTLAKTNPCGIMGCQGVGCLQGWWYPLWCGCCHHPCCCLSDGTSTAHCSTAGPSGPRPPLPQQQQQHCPEMPCAVGWWQPLPPAGVPLQLLLVQPPTHPAGLAHSQTVLLLLLLRACWLLLLLLLLGWQRLPQGPGHLLLSGCC